MLHLQPMIELRTETLSDKSKVFDVVERAFGRPDEAELANLVRDRGNSTIAQVALDDDSIVGYVLASQISFEPSNNLHCIAIGPVAVVPESQGAGVGSKLMRHTIHLATVHGFDAVFLLGNPSYYSRFGFTRTHIANEYGATDAFMALELRDGSLQGVVAKAKYVGEFSEIGV